jgi:aminopeptidase
VYGSTLLDENAATHIAFGRGFDFARVGGAATGDPSVNTSAIHVDVMIGTDDMTVTGLDGDGARIPLIADGSWQL